MPKWHLYLIRTADRTLYAGITTDVARRLAEHQTGGGRCARYLRGRGPLKLVFVRRLGSRSLALKAERCIKRLPKHQKEKIVRTNPSRSGLIERLGIRTNNGGCCTAVRKTEAVAETGRRRTSE
jgi:putative endonuclease